MGIAGSRPSSDISDMMSFETSLIGNKIPNLLMSQINNVTGDDSKELMVWSSRTNVEYNCLRHANTA